MRSSATAKSLGIDIGSVSVKVVLVEDGEIIHSSYKRYRASPFETLQLILRSEFSGLDGSKIRIGSTGIGGKNVQSVLGGMSYGEIAALASSNLKLLSHVRTVIEMGGEDSKLLILDNVRQTVEDFAMNAQCAAGTGSFLDQQAGRLKISIEDEFGKLALKSKNPPRIAGRCSVFAKSDMIHLQQVATPDYDIVAGLCFAVARNFKSSIARGKKFDKPIAFEGGVAANPGMIRAFTEVLELQEGELIIPDHFNLMAAIGAAFNASSDENAQVESFDSSKIEAYLSYREKIESGRDALSFDNPDNKFYTTTQSARPTDFENLDVYLGIDIGSLSTNVVLIDRDLRVIARRYLMTEGRPIEAVRRGIEEVGNEVGDRVNVIAVGTTGSGRYLIGDFVGADMVRNEITAQATAAVRIDPEVDTIFEIGGQDSKYISLKDKAVIDFEMNKACAAGTGSFLQEQAEKLDINIEKEFGDRALKATCPVGCGERCTVFMESDLVSHQRSGANRDDLVAGLAYSIASNYLNKVVGDRRIGDHIFFQGGVAWNKAVVAAFEQLTGKSVTVPPHHDVTGAIGAAILASECLDDEHFKTAFKGFDLHKRRYEVDSFTCEDCSNQCEIHTVEIEGEEPLYYGARCEKYDVKQKSDRKLPPDYVRLRQKLLFKRYTKFKKPERTKGRVGIPMVLHFYEYYPFWRAFFESLDYQVVNSDMSSQQIVEESLELFSAETCFPIKMVYGHISNLIRKKVDTIFLPSLIRVADEHTEAQGSYMCPYVQSIGASVSACFDFDKEGINFISSAIELSGDPTSLRRRFRQLAIDLKLSDKDLKSAIDCGLKAFKAYRLQVQGEGAKILSELKEDDKALVVISRPYNGYDRRLSLELPEKIRNLGHITIPLDFLPLDDASNAYPYMYWRYGQRILGAADYVRNHPNLFAVYITSFGCGPDSFITHFFGRQMSGKPFLQLELDEHSADAGAITRCEAFVDSLRFYKFTKPISSFGIQHDDFRPFEKIIYIPNMCDHAYIMRAALERFGLTAEVLDEPDELTLEYGKKFTSGKECYPCILTTGDMIKKLKSDSCDPNRSVFFMPGAEGPCRFGLYRQYHRLILDDLGFKNTPIFSPNSKDGYSGFGLEGTEFRKITWRGMVFVDCLIKMLNQVRPYEVHTGETEKLYYKYLQLVCHAVLKDESLNDVAENAAKDFRAVEVMPGKLPLVGLVGEIYLRNNRFSNNHLVTKLEKLGVEVRLATFTEWPLYTSYTFRRDTWRDRNVKGIIKSNIQIGLQERMEHKIVHSFAKHFPVTTDRTVGDVLKKASKYFSLDIKGEAILSVGKAVEMTQDGCSGIINAMPFNCMPGTVVSSISKKVSEDLNRVPWLNISYEGLRDSGEETRLEAFTEQVKAFARSSKGKKPKLTAK